MEQKLAAAEHAHCRTLEELSKLRSEAKRTLKKLKEVERERDDASTERDEAKAKIQALQSAQRGIEARLEESENAKEAMKRERDDASTERDEAKAKIQALQSAQRGIEARLEESEKRMRELGVKAHQMMAKPSLSPEHMSPDASAPGARVFGKAPSPDTAQSKRNTPRTKERADTEQKLSVDFDDIYMWQKAKQDKARDERRSRGAFPCDDAMAVSGNTVVVCDGVGEGGDRSGHLARQVTQAIIADVSPDAATQKINELLLSTANHKGVQEVLAEPKNPRFRTPPSTTVTVVSVGLVDNALVVESIEIGDSQWALLAYDGTRWNCDYVSKPHTYPRNRLCPLQLSREHQAKWFLNESKLDGQKITTRLDLFMSHQDMDLGACRYLLIAGSDGFWDNCHNGCGNLTHEQMKTKLATECNSAFTDWPNVAWQEGGFACYFGSRLKGQVSKTLDGPEIDSRSNQIIKKADDVSLFVGNVAVKPWQAGKAQKSRLKNEASWLFASGATENLAPHDIENGVEWRSDGKNASLPAQLPHTTRGNGERFRDGKSIQSRQVNSAGFQAGFPGANESPGSDKSFGGGPKIASKSCRERFDGYKVKPCLFHPYRPCWRGNMCVFAHGEEELRCRDWIRGVCDRKNCSKVHKPANPELASRALRKFEEDNRKHRSVPSSSCPSGGGPAPKRTRYDM